MPRLAANLSMMFTELPFLDRFAAAAAADFKGVEFLFPYDHPATEIRARLDGAGLALALFNMPPGDWAAGERGTAGLPGRQAEFRDGVMRAVDYAGALGCPCCTAWPASPRPVRYRAPTMRPM
jgi:hydroxypyruvate isomerase